MLQNAVPRKYSSEKSFSNNLSAWGRFAYYFFELYGVNSIDVTSGGGDIQIIHE